MTPKTITYGMAVWCSRCLKMRIADFGKNYLFVYFHFFLNFVKDKNRIGLRSGDRDWSSYFNKMLSIWFGCQRFWLMTAKDRGCKVIASIIICKQCLPLKELTVTCKNPV